MSLYYNFIRSNLILFYWTWEKISALRLQINYYCASYVKGRIYALLILVVVIQANIEISFFLET